MARGITTMEVRADGVAVITIINPPVNALSLDGITRLFSPNLFPFTADAACPSYRFLCLDTR
jgi:hypothetical protein